MSKEIRLGSVKFGVFSNLLALVISHRKAGVHMSLLDRNDAKKLAEILEQFARTGQVEDKKDV